MNADADGNLWVALENSFHIGRFQYQNQTVAHVSAPRQYRFWGNP